MRIRIRHPIPTLVPAVALSALLAVPLAQAQQTEPPATSPPPASDASDASDASGTTAPVAFRDLDANADGRLSKDEAAVDVKLARHFAHADRDGNGQLTEREFSAVHGSDARQY